MDRSTGGLIGWSSKLKFIVVLIGPRWVKPDLLGGPKSNVHSTPQEGKYINEKKDRVTMMQIENFIKPLYLVFPTDSFNFFFTSIRFFGSFIHLNMG